VKLSKEWQIIKAIISRNTKMFVSYKISVLVTILWPLPILALNLYQYLGFGPSETLSKVISKEYGIVSLSGMIIIGTVIYLLYNRLLWGTGASIQAERWMGTIDVLFLTPASRMSILLGNGLSSLIEGSWWICGVFILSWMIFGIDIALVSLPAVFVTLASTMLALISLGVFFASFFILTRAAEQLAVSFQAPIRYFAGVAFPVSALPQFLQFISYMLPITYGIQALRKTVLAGATILDLLKELSLLYLFAGIFLILGYYLLRVMENKAKRDGSLYHY
jgi:ABC-2 type transport system permease protein